MKRTIKCSIIFHAEFLKPLDAGGDPNPDNYILCLRTTTTHLCNEEEIAIFLEDARSNAEGRIDDFVKRGSGWILDEILATDVELGACNSLNGGCNLISITHIDKMKKIPLITDEDNSRCFFLAVAFHYKRTHDKKTLEKFIKKYINETVTAPVNYLNIQKFERDNPQLECKINVLYSEDNEIYPIHISKQEKQSNQINLLLFKTMLNGEIVNHYAYIEDLDKLLKKTYRSTAVHGKKGYGKGFHCINCLQKFTTEEKLEDHTELCLKNKPQKIIIPEKGIDDIIKFKRFGNKFKTPIVGFLDFEASQNKPENKCDTCAMKKKAICTHKTVIKSIQKPITYSLIILNEGNKIIFKKTYNGDDCVEDLVNTLLNLETSLLSRINPKKEMDKLTFLEIVQSKAAVLCHICEKALLDDRVFDHDHISGKFIAMAHNSCNLNRNAPKSIPIFAHNMEGYDSHFILQQVKNDPRIKKIKGLPHNTEKFRTITINSFVFLDSFAFLSTSLANLVDNLAEDNNHKFPILDQMELYNVSNYKRLKPLLLRKGVYPYDFATGIDVLVKTKKIPKIGNFFSILSDANISKEEYAHAKNVFKKFKCKNMLDYTSLYCATDVALLAEVFLQFREEIMTQFGLDCW